MKKRNFPLLLIIIFLFSISFPQPAFAWKFAALGDTRPGNSYDHSQNVYGIIYKIPNSERKTILNVGDLTLDGAVSQWDNFRNITSPLGVDWNKTNPPGYITSTGNHDEHDSNWIANWANYLPALKGLSAYPDIPAHVNGLYGSVKIENAIFVFADYLSRPSGQEAFLQNTLNRAKTDPQVVWKFVAFHSPPVSCGGSHSDWTLGKTWHDNYFQPNGVDIIFAGDNHYYERTCPFKNGLASSGTNETSVCDTANRGNFISNTSGVIHIINGGGGAELYSIGSCSWLESATSKHEFMEFEILGNTLHAKVWDTDTNVGTSSQPPASTNFALIDEFTIQKGSAATPTSGPFPTSTPRPSPTIPPNLPKCFGADNLINGDDVSVWLTNYAKTNSVLETNGDNKINSLEFGYLLSNWLKTCGH